MSRDLQIVMGAANVAGSNVAASKVVGGKRRETQFSASFVGDTVGFVQSKVRKTLDVQGAVIGTGIATDFAINGTGMVVVKQNPNDPTSANVFTRSCSFRLDENGNYTNNAGYALRAWQLDKDGNPPIDNSLISSLSTVNFNNISSKAEATTSVSLAINLNSEQAQLKGAGKVIHMLGTNSGTRHNEIIAPDDSRFGSLKYGDSLRLTVGTDRTRIYTFQLDGITVSRNVTAAGPNGQPGIFGATTTTQQFRFDPPPGGGGRVNERLLDGDSLTINVNGEQTTFTARQRPNANNNEFNSVEGLKNLLNNTGTVVATIKNNQLYVGPKDPNASLTFTNDILGGRIKEELGLTDIPGNQIALVNQIRRFNTLDSLKLQMRACGGNLAAAVEANGLDFSAANASDTLRIECLSEQPRLVDALPVLGNGTLAGRASITLTSSGHSLRPGDYIRLNNIGGAHQDGMYMVTTVLNPNQFTVGVLTGANFAGVDASINIGVGAPRTTWQKAPGHSYDQINIVPADTITYAGVAPTFDLTLAAGNPVGYAQHDLIYVSGLNNTAGVALGVIPDGYYRITALPGAGVVRLGKVGGGNFGAQINGGNPLILNGVGATIQKVGATNAGALVANNVNFNRNLLTTFANETRIRVYVQQGHQYQAGDNFTFRGNGLQAPIVQDNLNITTGNDNPHTITAVDSAAGWIEFNATQPGGPAMGGDATFTNLGGGALNSNLYLDFTDRMFRDLGLSSADIDTNLPASYDAGDVAHSLSSNTQPRDRIFSHPIEVIDSLGSKHILMIRFAKLSQNNWAVEVAGQENDGTFEYDTNNKRDGQLLAGTLLFNGDGARREFIIENSVTVNWNNGSLPSTINIDWGAFGDGINSVINRGVRQTTSPNDAVSKPNGNTAGALEGVSIDEEGFVSGSFSNGLTRKLYQIPIVTFANINGLEAGGGDTYTATRLSGPAMLKFAGVGGNATILAKAVEGSNTETTSELLKIQELQNQIQAEARVVGVDNQNFKTILSELSR